MRDELLEYYQGELSYLRTMATGFAERYPKIADRLMLDPKGSNDPHVERLIQGFAFLAARVHLKIDDDFPEVTEALLNAVYPNYLRPIPAMTIVQFALDPEKGKLPAGYRIPAGRELLSRLEVKGEDALSTRCTFRTCYDTVVWPLEVSSAEWLTGGKLTLATRRSKVVAALKLRLRCFNDASFATMQLDALRMYLDGADHVPYTLYELLVNACTGIVITDPARPAAPPLELPADAIRPVGFEPNEGVLPSVARSFAGYRLLQEYFAFPRKFLFVDLEQLNRLRPAGFGTEADVHFLFSRIDRPKRVERFEAEVHASSFRLGCTPAANLFEVQTEPCKLDQRSTAYHLIADAYHLRATHTFAIESVALRTGSESIPIEPLYSFRRASTDRRANTYYVASRKTSVSRRESYEPGAARHGGPPPEQSKRDGWAPTEIWISFSDRSGRVARPEADSFDARLTCFNGDLPNRMAIGTGAGAVRQSDFDLPGGGPFRSISALSSPSAALPAPAGKAQLWRLISLLSLNYVSLTEGGLDALRTMLLLHNTNEAATWSGRDHIEGLVSVRSRPHYTRVVGDYGVGFARGRRVELEFDEDKFEGAGAFLFASVLERFLGLYASLNSFSVLVARTRQRRDVMREWPPRAGWKSPL
jgi:type VI secretion system protein ImpG